MKIFFFLSSSRDDRVIVNVVPGDFNGDSIMDFLITYKKTLSDKTLYSSLYLCEKKGQDLNDIKYKIDLELEMLDQPFVGEYYK